MKKLKINLLPIIGMMVAVATVAFTAPKEEANIVAIPFTYLGTDLDKDTFTDPGNWTTSSGQNCTGLGIPCEVLIDEPGVTDIPSLVSHLESLSPTDGEELIDDSAETRQN